MLLNKTACRVTKLEECYRELSQLLDVNNASDSLRYGDNINRVVNTIGNMFSKSALDTFGKIYINNKRRHNNDKPECKFKRKQCHKVRSRYSLVRIKKIEN